MWVFSGQGSQWAEMGKDLLANEPVFAETIAVVECELRDGLLHLPE